MSKYGKARRNRRLADEGRQILSQVFPLCFAGKGDRKRPLKIGIFHDIRAAMPGMTSSMTREALRDYTSGPTYLRSVVETAHRLDLEGNVTGEVSASEAENARERLDRLQKSTKPRGGRKTARSKTSAPAGQTGRANKGGCHEVASIRSTLHEKNTPLDTAGARRKTAPAFSKDVRP